MPIFERARTSSMLAYSRSAPSWTADGIQLISWSSPTRMPIIAANTTKPPIAFFTGSRLLSHEIVVDRQDRGKDGGERSATSVRGRRRFLEPRDPAFHEQRMAVILQPV